MNRVIETSAWSLFTHLHLHNPSITLFKQTLQNSYWLMTSQFMGISWAKFFIKNMFIVSGKKKEMLFVTKTATCFVHLIQYILTRFLLVNLSTLSELLFYSTLFQLKTIKPVFQVKDGILWTCTTQCFLTMVFSL